MTVSRKVLERHRKNVLIETGTYKGTTTKLAVEELGYDKVHTIELQEYLFNESKNNLKDLIDLGKVFIYNGNSNVKIKEVLDLIDEPVTILLDAHIDGGNFIPNVTPNVSWCPLYEELLHIKNHKINNHTILIDDVRIIGKIGWGSGVILDKLVEILMEINPNYVITYEEGETPNDVLVARVI